MPLCKAVVKSGAAFARRRNLMHWHDLMHWHGGGRVMAIIGCAMSGCAMYATVASAHCVLVGLGGAMSLVTCSGGTHGTMVDLGNGLGSFRLTNGTTGILNLAFAATSATAVATAASADQSGTTGEAAPTSPQGGTTPTGPTLTFIVDGASGTPKSAALPLPNTLGAGSFTSLNAPLNAPLTPPFKTIANTAFVPPPPARMVPATPANAQ